MEELKKKNKVETGDKEIVFSKSIKAGKRIYYLDVKKNRKEELFLAITESKKIISGEGDSSLVSFEKHKIFLYKEDFAKFITGLTETIEYINKNQHSAVNNLENTVELETEDNLEAVFSETMKVNNLNDEFKIDIDFE